MQLFEIKTDTFHTAMLSQYLNQSNNFQLLKGFRVGLCQLRLGVLPINNNLHRYSACAIQRNCVVCVNAIENEEHLLFACPLCNDIREKFLNDTSQNTVTASLENVLSWKSKTNMFRLAKFVFSAIRRRKEFTGSN